MAMVSKFEMDITIAIQDAVRKKVKEIVEDEANKAIKNCFDRIKASVDSIALSVLDHYEFSMGHHALHITVKKDIDGPDIPQHQR